MPDRLATDGRDIPAPLQPVGGVDVLGLLVRAGGAESGLTVNGREVAAVGVRLLLDARSRTVVEVEMRARRVPAERRAGGWLGHEGNMVAVAGVLSSAVDAESGRLVLTVHRLVFFPVGKHVSYGAGVA